MEIDDVIIILGIITLIFLITTFSFGFFKLNIKNRFKIHRILGIITLLFALTHGFLVFYITYLKK